MDRWTRARRESPRAPRDDGRCRAPGRTGPGRRSTVATAWRSTRRLVLRYAEAPCRGSFRIDRLVPKATLTSFLRRESLSLDRIGAQARASA